MLESLLIECIADIICEKETLWGFSEEDLRLLEIEICRIQKSKIGKEHFYMALARVNKEQRSFYVSERRAAEKAGERRNKRIDEALS